MSPEEKTNFDAKAGSWDDDPGRVRLANDVADAIIRETHPSREMEILDFGSGSGLVTLRLQPLVKWVTAVDSSRGMLQVLRQKAEGIGATNISYQILDVEEGGVIEGRYHLIVSSMAMHHVADPPALVRLLVDRLLPGGVLAIADLDTEDGLFHSDNAGVRFFGFERTLIGSMFRNSGLTGVRDLTAASVTRRREGDQERQYTVFLICGTKAFSDRP